MTTSPVDPQTQKKILHDLAKTVLSILPKSKDTLVKFTSSVSEGGRISIKHPGYREGKRVLISFYIRKRAGLVVVCPLLEELGYEFREVPRILETAFAEAEMKTRLRQLATDLKPKMVKPKKAPAAAKKATKQPAAKKTNGKAASAKTPAKPAAKAKATAKSKASKAKPKTESFEKAKQAARGRKAKSRSQAAAS